MDEITEITQEIERLRSKLVDFTIKVGDFMQEGVLHLSCRLDELIVTYYRLITNKESTVLK
jgi:Ni,Fe-hydrogenase III large subunit